MISQLSPVLLCFYSFLKAAPSRLVTLKALLKFAIGNKISLLFIFSLLTPGQGLPLCCTSFRATCVSCCPHSGRWERKLRQKGRERPIAMTNDSSSRWVFKHFKESNNNTGNFLELLTREKSTNRLIPVQAPSWPPRTMVLPIVGATCNSSCLTWDFRGSDFFLRSYVLFFLLLPVASCCICILWVWPAAAPVIEVE